jgi:indole-3-glycerol phosphate synthase
MKSFSFTIVIVIVSILYVSSFSTRTLSVRDITAPLTMNLNIAANTMIKKGKMKDLKVLKDEIAAAGDKHPINLYLKDGIRAFGVEKPVDFIESITNRYETLSILPEYNKKVRTGFIIGMPPPEIIGGVLRDAGSRGIFVSLDKRSGGATVEEFARFTREQSRSKKFMPGPIPVIWNDIIVDDIQIVQAASVGAAAITLQPDLADNLAASIKLAREHHMEPIALARTLEEANAAITAGARCICLHNLEESKLIELRTQLPDTPGVLYGARLRAEADYSSYTEIDQCWLLRDNNFNFVWPSPEAVYVTGMIDIYPNILAMKAKASRIFLSPRQFLMDRNKEGAKEYLGDILY